MFIDQKFALPPPPFGGAECFLTSTIPVELGTSERSRRIGPRSINMSPYRENS